MVVYRSFTDRIRKLTLKENGGTNSKPVLTRDACFFCGLTRINVSSDPPDPPTRLKIQNARKRTVTLTWKAPKNDGGSPVTHYSVDLLCWAAGSTQKESWRR